MSDRPTPETDALVEKYKGNGFTTEYLRETVGKLERERDEGWKQEGKRQSEYDKLFDEAEQIRKERDEAREALREILANAESHLRFLDPPTRNRWRAAAGLEAAK